ncbi:MAG TPA: prepilin-type N-terminal cleavage/methylation domain-containing protein [Solirubrobacterales bacterium]|nr:prepilin-type N-terminal cleavage/methylation domain-containing protein [Solirubrobacterales bacterium]
MSVMNLRERLGARMRGEESGFTLVELLVVMLILGLLAAIAIPAFFNQRDKANDSDAKATVRTAQTAMETFATDSDGSYAGAVVADLVAIEPTLSEAGADLTVAGVTADSYSVVVLSSTGTSFWATRAADGTSTLGCDTDAGGCPSGDWELAAAAPVDGGA